MNLACHSFRCLIEAWSLLRQHSNHLDMSELLGYLYESCQELGLIKELLKLPLGLGEQVGQSNSMKSYGYIVKPTISLLSLHFFSPPTLRFYISFLKVVFFCFVFRNVWRSFSRAQGVFRTENC